MGKNLQIGFNTFDSHVRAHAMDCDGIIEKCGGVDFVVCHFDPNGDPLNEQCERAKAVAARLKSLGIPFAANFEAQNFNENIVSADGVDFANHPDGTHRLDLPEAYISAIKEGGDLIAVMYDEFEHAIINRNLSILLATKLRHSLPVFPRSYTDSVRVEGENLNAQIGAYAADLKKKGAPAFVGEHVFPVLYHTFARNGIIPNFKSQKEIYTNVQFAIAAGAALEYGTPLWTCVDLWFMNTFPGHSPNEMYHNLVFAWLTGVDRAYVEASNAFVSTVNGEEMINAYGDEYIRFVKEYRGKERAYNVRDYRPEIGIIRYDDGFWGQGTTPVVWPNELLGNPMIKPRKRHKEWVKVFRLITHGETGAFGLAWDRVEPRSFLKKHRSFVTMNGAAVFDDRVRADKLGSLKLCFLCGEYISPETLADVKKLVNENGLTVVTPKRFAPAGIRSTLHDAYREYPDGRGRWIVCDSFSSPRLKKRLAPMLGEKGEMKFTFGDRTVRLAVSADGESFTVK